ncbi:hypothetical protein CWC26_08180 [Pseudoalteromonas sp. S4488]|nr:hypothetical protein EXT43_08700 [Pseudoalteromonas sp. CO109Y]TMO36976.1 hypothetical protein CWC27_05955 [Pseudoalteromonas sp. S4491]TMO39558.1 hypothetical protein CWC26_08180 [Pseudoalteromonas sp. S4488]
MALKIMKLATKNKFILLISRIISTIVVNLPVKTQHFGRLCKLILHKYAELCRITLHFMNKETATCNHKTNKKH